MHTAHAAAHTAHYILAVLTIRITLIALALLTQLALFTQFVLIYSTCAHLLILLYSLNLLYVRNSLYLLYLLQWQDGCDSRLRFGQSRLYE